MNYVSRNLLAFVVGSPMKRCQQKGYGHLVEEDEICFIMVDIFIYWTVFKGKH